MRGRPIATDSGRHQHGSRQDGGRLEEKFAGIKLALLLDARQYRTGNGDGQPRSILGTTQMQWLIAGLADSRAGHVQHDCARIVLA